MDDKKYLDFFSAWSLFRLISVQMAIRAAVQLNIFNIIANSGPDSQLSASEIVSHIATTNPKKSIAALERILRMLAANAILSTTLDGDIRVYSLTNQSRCFATNSSGISLADGVIFVTEKELVNSLYMTKDAVLDPDTFYGSSNNVFELFEKNKDLSRLFNETMAATSKMFFNEVLKVYEGFKDVKELVDVGGGIGASLGRIISVYPHIHGINFDLAHVIAEAPNNNSGVKHVAGDMFESIPNTQAILLKWILHDWDDEKCKTLLKNCWSALPEYGKVIVVEFAIPEVLENNVQTWNVVSMDFHMMTFNPGGKERTLPEFAALAKDSGFPETNIIPINNGIYVLEFVKNK